MATYDDILGNGGGTPFPKGSKEWHEQQQDGSSVPPPVKGTQEWAEQKAATAPVVTYLKPDITTTQTPPTKQEGSEGGALSYAELFKKLNPYTPPTDEELAKEKKKQKRDQIFAAIGDGISALSNLFFTTQYAPNMYTGKNTMSERTRVRYDRLMKEREGKEKEYYAGLMKAKIADEEKADRDRKWQRLVHLDDINEKKAAAEQERKDALAGAQRGKYEAAARKDDAMTAYYQAKEDAINQGLPLDIAIKKAKEAKERALANKANRQGTASWVSGSGGTSGSYSIYNPNTGETEYFKNQGERDRRAGELGYDMSPGSSSSESSDNFMGNKKTTSQKGASASARLGQQEAEKKRKANGKKTGLGLGNGENNSSGKKTGLGL